MNVEEKSCLLASLIIICSITCDSLTSVDLLPFDSSAPSSMRSTSIILVLILASPAIKNVNVVDQRTVVVILLAITSFWGLHRASSASRATDAIFVVTTLLGTVYVTKNNGIEHKKIRPDSNSSVPTMTALCGSLFAYNGLRGLRSAFTSAHVAADFVTEFDSVHGLQLTRGEAAASMATTLPLAFAHSVSLCVGLLISVRDDKKQVSDEICGYGLVILVASVWALLGQSKVIDELPAIFGPNACRGGVDVCLHSAVARRLVMVNGSPASAFLAGLGAVCFARVETKIKANDILKTQGVGNAFGILVVGTWSIFAYSNFAGSEWHTDVVLIIAMVSVFISATSYLLVGTCLYATCMAFEQLRLLQNYGASQVFVHLTHTTLFLSISLHFIWILLGLVTISIASCNRELREDSRIYQWMSVTSSIGSSITFGLFIASSLLLAASNGNLPQEDDVFRGGSAARSMVAFVLDHFVPFLSWVPIISSQRHSLVRFQFPSLLRLAWVAALPVNVVVYFVVLGFLEKSAPSVFIIDTLPTMAASFAALTAWAAASEVLS